MTYSKKDVASGLIFAAFGLFYGSIAYLRLPIGEALDMGPGYFPILLSGLLISFGLFVAIRAFVRQDATPIGKVPWRGLAMNFLALAAFVLTLRPLGLFLTSVLVSFLACLSMPSVRLGRCALISLGIGVFCTFVFAWVLRLPIPVLGTMFR